MHKDVREKFLSLGLESTRKSYYPQLQKQLELSTNNEKRLQLLIDNMPAQICYINSHEQYVLVNKAFEKALHKDRCQIIGRCIRDVVGHVHYRKLKPYIEDALSGRPGRFELSLADEKGVTRWFGIDYVPEVDQSGEINGFYVLAVDLTEKKEAEEERIKLKDRLRQAQKMEAIGTLAGGIAHDFNNILSGLFGYSQLIDSHINEPELIREYNSKIIENAQRAASLIRQILSFSRQTQYQKQPLCLAAVVENSVEFLRSTIPSTIEITSSLKSKATISADETQIHQVILNLCTNAYQAMEPGGGTLTIALEETQLEQNSQGVKTILPPGRYLILDIGDTGAGIKENDKHRIFDPYFTTKKKGKGTGLGLAIVNGIIKKHNGHIDFETEKGSGTTFHIYFPIIEKTIVTRKRNTEEKNEAQIASTHKIMVVDDEPLILDTFSQILSRKGFEVSCFADGQSALETFKNDTKGFDLIITDMTMPRMTGDKLSREILKLRGDIPIIVCTGYHEKFTASEAEKAGVKKYIQKPVSVPDLLKEIKDLVNA